VDANYGLDSDYGIWCSVDAAYAREARMAREDDLTPPEDRWWQKVEVEDEAKTDPDVRELRPDPDP
jgi:hypothetical protein